MKFKKNHLLLFTLTMIALSVIMCLINTAACEKLEEVKILSVRGLITDDYYIVFGELYNGANKFIKNMKVEVSLLDNQARLVAKINATTCLSVTPPKRRSPFIGYYFGADKNLIWNITINKVAYDYTNEYPGALAFVYSKFYNGMLAVHVLNNCTLATGQRKATNNLKVVAALYAQNKIVAVSAGYLNLNDPGLLWDLDTSTVGSGEPITVYFVPPFNLTEVISADKIVASVESRDFTAQYQLIGLRENDYWNWKLLYEEEISKNDNESINKKGAGWNLESLLTLIILTVLSALIVTALYLRREKSRRLKRHLK